MDRETLIGLAVALLVVLFILFKPEGTQPVTKELTGSKARFSAGYGTPLLDGDGSDAVWESVTWRPLDQVWLGNAPSPQDVSGRYKLAWDDNNLYVLAEITDDTLVDTHPDGLDRYWDDDCLEIFVDEDASGGNHQYNYNAFAYHIALDGKVTDAAPDKSFQYFNDHCVTRRVTLGKRSIWEVAVRIFDGKKYETEAEHIPKMLRKGKKMGFALAYCDNDRSPERENFVGNVVIEGADKNRAWIDAGLFGELELQ